MVDIEGSYNQRRVGGSRQSKLGGDRTNRLPITPDAIAINNGEAARPLAKQGRRVNLKCRDVRPPGKHGEHSRFFDQGRGGIEATSGRQPATIRPKKTKPLNQGSRPLQKGRSWRQTTHQQIFILRLRCGRHVRTHPTSFFRPLRTGRPDTIFKCRLRPDVTLDLNDVPLRSHTSCSSPAAHLTS